jgi:hypothetical protein
MAELVGRLSQRLVLVAQASQAAEEPDSWCHSERSEESLFDPSAIHREILRFAQNDREYFFRRLFSLFSLWVLVLSKDGPSRPAATRPPAPLDLTAFLR